MISGCYLRRQEVDMAYRIDSSRCVGCGACAYECLFGVPKPLDETKQKYVIDRDSCIGCGQCEAICPNGAIFPEAGQRRIKKVTIDQELCIGCSLCKKTCKADAPYGELWSRLQLIRKNAFAAGSVQKNVRKKRSMWNMRIGKKQRRDV